MRALLPLACIYLLASQHSQAQEIAGAESLRDRSRILQKKNPVSSETAGFSNFNGLTASGDAESVSQTGYLWSTSIPGTQVGSFSFLSRYNSLTENFGYGSNINHVITFDDEGKSAISINLSTNRFDRRFDSLQYLWDTEVDEATDLVLPNTARFDVRTLETRTKNAKLFGQTSLGNTRLYIVGSHNVIDDTDERLRLEYKTSGDAFLDGSRVSFDKNRKRNSLRRSPDSRIETVYGIGFDKVTENSSLRAGVVSRAWKRLRPNIYTIQFEDNRRTPLEVDFSEFANPTILDDLSDQDLGNFDFQEIRFEDKATNDSDDIAYFDYDWTGEHSNFNYKISTGSFYREKTRDNYELRENYDGYQGSYRLETATGSNRFGSVLNGDYELGYFPSEEKILAHFEENRASYSFDSITSEQDSLSQNYNSYERVFGNYVNAQFDMGDWNLSTGLRYEKTKIETFGYEVIANEDGSIEVSPEFGNQDYDHTFPTFSLSYQLSESSTVLFSWQETIARPDYYDLIPYQIIARSSEVVRSGNPNLSPTILDTATISWSKQIAEDYTLSIGASSIEIQDFIYSTEETILDGTYEGFKFRSKFNGQSASIQGFDISLAGIFEPDFLNGRKITARLFYQYKNSNAETGSESFSETPLPQVARHKSRISLAQTIGRFQWLLQVDHTDKALDQFGPSLSTFEYLDQRLTTNARFVYKFNQKWKTQLDFINLGKASLNETIGQDNRLGKTTVDSWQCRFDISRNW